MIEKKTETCVCWNEDRTKQLWRCSPVSKLCTADLSDCNYPDCDCTVPYWAISYEKRTSFCQKKKEGKRNENDRVPSPNDKDQ